MTDFTKPKQPPYLRYDAVVNTTDQVWVILTPKGPEKVYPGDSVVTEPVVLRK